MSAIMMRRKALAREASQPMREKEASRGSFWWNSMRKPRLKASRSQLRSSPGYVRGKSLDDTSVMVSSRMPTIWSHVWLDIV
jgi:hypothetical protein